jgi:hypothetical protein
MTVSEAHAPKKLPSIASLLKDSWSFLSTHGSLIYGYAAWLLLPILVMLGASRLNNSVGEIIIIVASVVIFALSLWASAAIMLAITELKRPDLYPKDIKGSVSEIAWRRAATLLWIGLLVSIVEAFGLILFIVPGIIFMVWFVFAEVEAVLTGSGTFSSLEQSRERVRGAFWPILWRLFAFLVLIGAVMIIILIPVVASSGITDYTLLFTDPPAWLEALINAIQILFLPVIICYQLHLYFALRTP